MFEYCTTKIILILFDMLNKLNKLARQKLSIFITFAGVQIISVFENSEFGTINTKYANNLTAKYKNY